MSDEFYSIDGRLFDKPEEDPQTSKEVADYQRNLPIIKEVLDWFSVHIAATNSVDYIVMDETTDMLDVKAQLLAQKYLRFKLMDKQAEFIDRFEQLEQAVKEKRDDEKDS